MHCDQLDRSTGFSMAQAPDASIAVFQNQAASGEARICKLVANRSFGSVND
jgi:hypothetical protein